MDRCIDLPINSYKDASFNFDISQANRTSGTYDFTQHKLTSLFGRVNYNYQEKYLFTGIYRRDGSSRFGANNKFGMFPSFSAGWVANKEGFWKQNSIVNTLKVRGGYGGFGKEGVHNVLEPAAFGQPVIWGEKDEKYIEAVGLRKAGGGFKIKSANELIVLAQALISNEEKYKEAAVHAKNFITKNAGATHKTIQFIKDQQLLP